MRQLPNGLFTVSVALTVCIGTSATADAGDVVIRDVIATTRSTGTLGPPNTNFIFENFLSAGDLYSVGNDALERARFEGLPLTPSGTPAFWGNETPDATDSGAEFRHGLFGAVRGADRPVVGLFPIVDENGTPISTLDPPKPVGSPGNKVFGLALSDSGRLVSGVTSGGGAAGYILQAVDLNTGGVSFLLNHGEALPDANQPGQFIPEEALGVVGSANGSLAVVLKDGGFTGAWRWIDTSGSLPTAPDWQYLAHQSAENLWPIITAGVRLSVDRIHLAAIADSGEVILGVDETATNPLYPNALVHFSDTDPPSTTLVAMSGGAAGSVNGQPMVFQDENSNGAFRHVVASPNGRFTLYADARLVGASGNLKGLWIWTGGLGGATPIIVEDETVSVGGEIQTIGDCQSFDLGVDNFVGVIVNTDAGGRIAMTIDTTTTPPTRRIVTVPTGYDPEEIRVTSDGRVALRCESTANSDEAIFAERTIGSLTPVVATGDSLTLSEPQATVRSGVAARFQLGEYTSSEDVAGATHLGFVVVLEPSESFYDNAVFVATLLDCNTACPADLNGDSVVDGADLAAMLAFWGSPNACADLNHDGTVGGPDLAALLSAYGPCP